MATAALSQQKSVQPRRASHGERYFFSGMALLLLAIVLTGFARTYFLAGMVKAPLPSPIIHFHAVVFSTWILLLIVQTSLVSAGRTDIHRRLEVAGFMLACLMVVVGVMAATNMLSRGLPPGIAQTFYAIPMGFMLLFAILIFAAFRTRRNPAAHKRLILIVTISILGAAFARWPFNVITSKPHLGSVFTYILVLLVVAYDLWSRRRVHPATIAAEFSTAILSDVFMRIGTTAAWQAFANWALVHVPH